MKIRHHFGMRNWIKGVALMAAAATSAVSAASAEEAAPPNVLFIAIDDLRPQLQSYGYGEMYTPHLDRMAGIGMQFDNAHCQQAVCTPSRCSMLTGCRPDTTRMNYKDERTESPKFEEEGGFYDRHPGLPQYFYRQGYYVRELGKINHGQFKYTGREPGKLSENRYSSRVYYYLDESNPDTQWGTEPFLKGKLGRQNWQYAKGENKARLLPYERGPEDLPDEAYPDADIAREALETLDRATASGKPFFLAVGFRRPHLPFCAPKWAWDVYDEEMGGPGIPLSKNPRLGKNQPDFLIANWAIAGHKGFPDAEAVYNMSDANRRIIRHGYYACVTHVDHQIGKLLDYLQGKNPQKKNHLENTIVVVWSDHGFHLGDHGMWGKSTNFELATRVPLYVYAPGMKGAGKQTDALVELVDLYPTLLDLCGFEDQHPVAPEGAYWTSRDTAAQRGMDTYLEGTSFAPLLDRPQKKWKQAAFSQFVRWMPATGRMGEGFSIRTPDFRYTEWRSEPDKGVDAGEVVFQELYDHRPESPTYDPMEVANVAAEPDFADILANLQERLHAGWTAALPE
jgi:iduronate 2-sulfatase